MSVIAAWFVCGLPRMEDDLSRPNTSQDVLIIQAHGEFLVVSVSRLIMGLDHSSGDILAGMILNRVKECDPPLVIIDLTGVELFDSMFLSVLLRCWKACATRGGMMVISGAGERARELLKVVKLDLLWPIYDGREEAMAALSSD
jgi:anti-anti-sigma factor